MKLDVSDTKVMMTKRLKILKKTPMFAESEITIGGETLLKLEHGKEFVYLNNPLTRDARYEGNIFFFM